jgi:hypothetical protein
MLIESDVAQFQLWHKAASPTEKFGVSFLGKKSGSPLAKNGEKDQSVTERRRRGPEYRRRFTTNQGGRRNCIPLADVELFALGNIV